MDKSYRCAWPTIARIRQRCGFRRARGTGTRACTTSTSRTKRVGFSTRHAPGVPAPDVIFKRADGRPWGAARQIRPILEASRRAKIEPPANFHITRHTFASHAIMSGAPLLVVAQALGHRDQRVSRITLWPPEPELFRRSHSPARTEVRLQAR